MKLVNDTPNEQVLYEECERYGLSYGPNALEMLLRHIRNNHAATMGAMQFQVDHWKGKCIEPGGLILTNQEARRAVGALIEQSANPYDRELADRLLKRRIASLGEKVVT